MAAQSRKVIFFAVELEVNNHKKGPTYVYMAEVSKCCQDNIVASVWHLMKEYQAISHNKNLD
jgi:hypothetical protein